jgi:hypothetical protein
VTVSVASAPVANPVRPTDVPFATDSLIVFAVPSLSVTGPTAASDVSSVRLIVNVSVLVDPSVDVACTVTV